MFCEIFRDLRFQDSRFEERLLKPYHPSQVSMVMLVLQS